MLIGKLPKKIFNKYFDNNKEFEKFEKEFSFKSNFNELFNYLNPSNKINNDSNLKYIIGIKGLSMLFTLCGYEFFILFNSPVFIKSKLSFFYLLRSLLYPFFNNGLRISPRVLLSCSGYILFYKFLCFLDNKKNDLINDKLNLKNKNKSEINNKEIDYSDEEETYSEMEKEILSKHENNDFIDIKIKH